MFFSPFYAGNVVVGIDVGSRMCKGSLHIGDKMFLARCSTGVNMQDTADEVMSELLRQSGLERRYIAFLVGTGYGRVALQYNEFPSRIQSEIFCHAMGAHLLGDTIRTVIDIGGQDSKIIALNADGSVADFVMNDKCAAGTGRFLEKAANMLSVSVEEMGPLSLKSKHILNISNQCIVFAESEMISLLAQGETVEDIAAGIHAAVVRRLAALSGKIRFEKNIMFTGGVAQNPGMCRAIEEILDCELEVPAINALYAGAIGAAYFAAGFLKNKKYKSKNIQEVRKLPLDNISSKIREKLDDFVSGKETRKKLGYICTYTPVELMYAADTAYLRLYQAGSAEYSAGGEQLTRSVYCDFIKGLLGRFYGRDPLYQNLDAVYQFYTCDCTKRVGEALSSNGFHTDTFVLPRKMHSIDSIRFLADEMRFFADSLEQMTGKEFSMSRLIRGIRLYNTIRKHLLQISSMRKETEPLLTGGEFYSILRGYFYLEPELYLSQILEIKKLLKRKQPVRCSERRVRIFLSGGLHADGNDRLISLIEKDCGAIIVAEDHCCGLKAIGCHVKEDAEPFWALAEGYLEKTPCTRMKPLTDCIDFSVKTAQEYRADAVIYSYVKFCPCYGQPKQDFVDSFKAVGFPVLEIGLDYSVNDDGQLRTRIETFLTMVREEIDENE